MGILLRRKDNWMDFRNVTFNLRVPCFVLDIKVIIDNCAAGVRHASPGYLVDAKQC